MAFRKNKEELEIANQTIDLIGPLKLAKPLKNLEVTDAKEKRESLYEFH